MSDFMIRNFYKQRKDFEKSSAERNLTLTFPDTVTEIKNIPYMTALPQKTTLLWTRTSHCKAVNHTSAIHTVWTVTARKNGTANFSR